VRESSYRRNRKKKTNGGLISANTPHRKGRNRRKKERRRSAEQQKKGNRALNNQSEKEAGYSVTLKGREQKKEIPYRPAAKNEKKNPVFEEKEKVPFLMPSGRERMGSVVRVRMGTEGTVQEHHTKKGGVGASFIRVKKEGDLGGGPFVVLYDKV